MAKSEKQRIKLLRIYEYLKMESDEDHPRGMSEIIDELNSQGIKCERKSVSSDIKLLIEYGYDIRMVGYKYYLDTRELNLEQIRFLMDAAQSAAFLTVEQTQDLCAALSMHAGSHRAELLRENVICFDKIKRNNDEVLQSVERINRAIENDKKISFKYFDLEIGGKRKYRKDGEMYVSNPVGMVFNGGYYYLVCYTEKYDDLAIYRIDRIDGLTELGEYRAHSYKERQFTDGELKNKITAFGMWDSVIEKVTLVFEREYIEDIYDKFGCDVHVSMYDDKHYSITEYVSVSDVFLGWCVSYGAHIKISSPENVRQKLIKMLEESLSLYK